MRKKKTSSGGSSRGPQKALRVEISIEGGRVCYRIKGPPAAPEALSWLLGEIAKDLGGG